MRRFFRMCVSSTLNQSFPYQLGYFTDKQDWRKLPLSKVWGNIQFRFHQAAEHISTCDKSWQASLLYWSSPFCRLAFLCCRLSSMVTGDGAKGSREERKWTPLSQNPEPNPWCEKSWDLCIQQLRLPAPFMHATQSGVPAEIIHAPLWLFTYAKAVRFWDDDHCARDTQEIVTDVLMDCPICIHFILRPNTPVTIFESCTVY